MKKKLIIVTGPTAVGKTELAIDLANKVNGEIISADSIQVYRYMDIGSAKVLPSETKGIKHHLIDVLNPDEEFNVHTFQQTAKECMEDIYKRGKIPIIVGGTGFYIQSVLYDIKFDETGNEHEYRKEFEELAAQKGNQYIHNMLRSIDPVSADNIHYNNLKRVIRALEYFYETGKRMSEHNEQQHENESPYDFVYFVLNDDRDALYFRINNRVDNMIKEGLYDEVKGILDLGYSEDLTSMQGIGYKEMAQCVNGNISLEDAIYQIKLNTRHFAKRQLTWFRRERDVTMININEFAYNRQKVLDEMLMILEKRNIIRKED